MSDLRQPALPINERDPQAPFALAPPPNGYAWWYLDAFSDDHAHALTVIAFIGSVFSPYYAFARSRGPTDPQAHCALNVALYGPRARWAMTERGATSLARDACSLRIGPSRLGWDGQAFTLDIREIAAPLPARLRGRIRLVPSVPNTLVYALDPNGRHRWGPLATRARVEVEFEAPALRWQGEGYFDSNDGDEPLEDCFEGWQWSRCTLAGGSTALFYDVVLRDGASRRLALGTDAHGRLQSIESLPARDLPIARWWRMPRSACADPGTPLSVHSTLEDTPFYARSALRGTVHGQQSLIMHESLSLAKFRKAWVRALLPFRMPRRL